MAAEHVDERTIEQLYQEVIKPLPASGRLQLATLILSDISPRAVVDYSEEWSEEDLRDFTRSTWQHIDRSLGEDADA